MFFVHKHGRRFIILYTNMAAVTSCENGLLESARRHAHTLDFVFSLLANKLLGISSVLILKIKSFKYHERTSCRPVRSVIILGKIGNYRLSYLQVKEHGSPKKLFGKFYSFKPPFLGFRVIQLGYWPDFNLESVFIFKNIFNMKSLTDFGKTVETGVDPHLQYRIKAPSFNVSKERIYLFLSATGRGECNGPCHAKKYY